jgi:hypothetical protein
MSKLDEKGRPLIMRNIIANRLEKFNQSGGDPAAVDRDIVATKDNAVKNYKAKPSEILMDGVDKYIKPDIPEEEATPNMYKTDKQKIVDSTVKEGPFARQRASDDGEFGVTYGTYVDDEEHMDVDLNEVTNSGATMMPKKRKTELLDEIKQKSTKTYAESKLANLYDSNRRWEIIKSRNDVSEIQKRKHQMEGGGAVEHSDESVSETTINGVEIPAFFLNETIVQDESGRVDYVQFKETQEVKSNLKTDYVPTTCMPLIVTRKKIRPWLSKVTLQRKHTKHKWTVKNWNALLKSFPNHLKVEWWATLQLLDI